MGQTFDPYLRWLGIRDAERPPNHYRLLGLDLFESDGDVIAVAADRQMAHVRTFQTGQFAPLSQRLLNELAAARICLLKPDRKAAYDTELKKRMGTALVAARAKSTPDSKADSSAGESATGGPTADTADWMSAASTPSISRKSAPPARKRKSLLPWIGLAVAGVALVAAVIVVQSMSEPGRTTNNDVAERPASSAAAATNSGHADQTADNQKPPSTKPTATRDAGNASSTLSPPEKSPPDKSAPDKSPPDKLPPDKSPPDKSPPDKSLSDKSQSGPFVKIPERVTSVADSDAPAANVSNPAKPTPDDSEPKKSQIIVPAKKPVVTPTAEPPAKPADAAPKPDLPPVPSKDALAAAEKRVASVYKAEMEQAFHGGPEAKAALAKQFAARGAETSDDPAARYVLLSKARDLAIAGGDTAIADNAVKQLGDFFAVDRPQDLQFNTFAALVKTVRNADAAAALLLAIGRAADRAIADDNFDLAGRLVRLQMGLATKIHDQAAAIDLKTRLAEIEQCKKEYTKLADALARLKTDPADADANLEAGRFYAFTENNFEKALAYLAKSSDTVLKPLAQAELAAPSDPAEQAKLGDGWWAAAQTSHEPAKFHLESHAAVWYSKAGPKLKGLAKGEVESRLQEVEAAGQKHGAASRKLLIKILTQGVWRMHFDPDLTHNHLPEHDGWYYPHYRFMEDGACRGDTLEAVGHWTLDGDTVTVHYDEVRPGDGNSSILEKYQIVGDTLRTFWTRTNEPIYSNKGIGTKIQ